MFRITVAALYLRANSWNYYYSFLLLRLVDKNFEVAHRPLLFPSLSNTHHALNDRLLGADTL